MTKQKKKNALLEGLVCCTKKSERQIPSLIYLFSFLFYENPDNHFDYVCK